MLFKSKNIDEASVWAAVEAAGFVLMDTEIEEGVEITADNGTRMILPENFNIFDESYDDGEDMIIVERVENNAEYTNTCEASFEPSVPLFMFHTNSESVFFASEHSLSDVAVATPAA